MTEVIPNLFIGNWQEAREAANERNKYIITVANDSPFIGDEKFDLVDGPGNDINIFLNAVKATVSSYRYENKVLVHCHGGRSRSGVVVVAAIMILMNKNMCEAYDLLANKYERTRIHPHLSKFLLVL